ncbi:MAG: endonuclease/exonuclease/phosphatase family protein [Candidatus Limnocylindrales bacterium]
MRIGSYNVENLFDRAKALALPTWADGKLVLEQHARVNELFNEPIYTPAIVVKILDLLGKLGLLGRDDAGQYAMLRQNRGRLLTRRNDGTVDIVAAGRLDWVGWVELKKEPVNELATQHTAMVIRDVNAQILGVVEAENRISLRDFSSILLQQVGATPYRQVMVIDGNDERGIDVGLMTAPGYEIVGIRSHVDDDDGQGTVFSRDCPEFTVMTPGGDEIVVLVNHYKSKGYGNQLDNDRRRRRQADRTKDIYERLVAEGRPNVVVLGDLNDTPDDPGDPPGPLSPLLVETDLRDVTTHPAFSPDPNGRPGTFGNGTKSQKIDYVLLSPPLFAKVVGGAIFRLGVWGGTNGTLFPHYPTMTRKVEQASDHAAIYADINL